MSNWYQIDFKLKTTQFTLHFTEVEWIEENDLTKKVQEIAKDKTKDLSRGSHNISVMGLYRLENDGTKTQLREEEEKISNLIKK